MTSVSNILEWVLWVLTPIAFICLIWFFIWIYLQLGWIKKSREEFELMKEQEESKVR